MVRSASASLSSNKKNKRIFAKDTYKYANILLSKAEILRLQRLSSYKILASTADSTPSYVSYLLRYGVGKQRTKKALSIMRTAKALLAFVDEAQAAYLQSPWLDKQQQPSKGT